MGLILQKKNRTHETFYGRKRKDYAAILYYDDCNDGVCAYGCVYMFFRVLYKGRILDLCLAQKYGSIDREHPTGLEIIQPLLEQNYSGMFICYCSQIDRGIFIMSDFKLGRQERSNFYVQYLVNTDTDRYSFINSKGQLETLSNDEYEDWSLDISLELQNTGDEE
jgi:hypothetical protein